MKTVHLLATEEAAGDLAPLVAAAEAAGMRVGWLDLEASAAPPEVVEGAVEAGVFRAVARADGGIVAVKRLVGPPVLGDLLREHFRGCRLVLVRGRVEAPRLARRGERWLVATDTARLELDTDRLVDRLRRPATTFLAP